jgi:hypothetical protein
MATFQSPRNLSSRKSLASQEIKIRAGADRQLGVVSVDVDGFEEPASVLFSIPAAIALIEQLIHGIVDLRHREDLGPPNLGVGPFSSRF